MTFIDQSGLQQARSGRVWRQFPDGLKLRYGRGRILGGASAGQEVHPRYPRTLPVPSSPHWICPNASSTWIVQSIRQEKDRYIVYYGVHALHLLYTCHFSSLRQIEIIPFLYVKPRAQ
jgi:hypothetical protein